MSTGVSNSDPGGPFTARDPARLHAMSAVLAQNWWAIALRGALGILFGIIAFVSPGATIMSLVLVFAAYNLVDGVVAIISAVRAATRHERWGLLILEGIASIATGLIALVWPGITVVVFVLLMAAWAIVTGVLMLAAAFRLTAHHGRVLLALSGVVSILYGMLLAFAPVIGAVVLTWWLGAYALLFGALLLVLAFRLRARRDDTGPGPASSTMGGARPAL